MSELDRPRLEGSVAVRDGRRLSFAEFGDPRGAAIVWMHGTPGARRQIPVEARAFAEEHDLRIIGVDRPGIGSSTPHLYRDILDWTGDLVELCDVLDIDTLRVIGLSGGGPYALAAGRGAARPGARRRGARGSGARPRVPTRSPAGWSRLAPYAAPVLSLTRVPLGFVLAQVIRLVRPIAGPIIDGYAAVQPRGDKELLARPEFRAMFLDDLLNGARFQVERPARRRHPVHPALGLRGRRRAGAGALVARRLRPHRPARARRAHGCAAAARPVHHRSTGSPTWAGSGWPPRC